MLRFPGEEGEGGSRATVPVGCTNNRRGLQWRSLTGSRSRAARRGGEGANMAIREVVGPGNGQVWLLVKGRACKKRLISSRFCFKGEAVPAALSLRTLTSTLFSAVTELCTISTGYYWLHPCIGLLLERWGHCQ